jgi:hypothetical protein
MWWELSPPFDAHCTWNQPLMLIIFNQQDMAILWLMMKPRRCHLHCGTWTISTMNLLKIMQISHCFSSSSFCCCLKTLTNRQQQKLKQNRNYRQSWDTFFCYSSVKPIICEIVTIGSIVGFQLECVLSLYWDDHTTEIVLRIFQGWPYKRLCKISHILAP